jgi:hypothetical protein
MASAKYYVWVADGRPYRLARPAAALQWVLRGHGLIVYDYPDDDHLQSDPAEDHTPFAATGWPTVSAYGVGHAVDIMPRNGTAAGRAENAAIARRLIADRNAGVPGVAWIKYLNWTDEQGVCRQERWMPNHTTRSSTDKGHVHVSSRSDCDNDTRAEGYDPLSTGGEDMDATQDGRLKDLWEWVALQVDPAAVVRSGDRFHFPPLGMQAAKLVPGLVTQVTALTATVQALAEAINNADGDIDLAAIFAKIDQAVADVNTQVEEATAAAVAAGQEARDAVGDLAEGGATQVRADSGPGSG